MKQLLFCLTLLFITLTANSKEALRPPGNNDVKTGPIFNKKYGWVEKSDNSKFKYRK